MENMNETPTVALTLEPEMEPEKKETAAETVEFMETTPGMDSVQQQMAQMAFTEEEKKMIDDFSAKIDVSNTNQILQYGAGTQKKMADFSDEALASVKTKELGEVGNLLTDVVGELKSFDAEEEKGLFGFFKKQGDKIETLKSRYSKAETNVAQISDAL